MATPRSRPFVLCAALATLLVSAARAQPAVAPATPPAPAAATASPSTPAALPSREAVDAWCSQHAPAKCAAFDALFADQEKLLNDLTSCVSQSCAFDKLFVLDGGLVGLNERTATVVFNAGYATDSCDEVTDHANPVFQMQSLLRTSLQFAWTESFLTAPAAVSADMKAAQAAASSICSDNSGGNPCSLADIILLEAREFETLNAQCTKTPCPWQEGKQLLSDFLLLKNNFEKLSCINTHQTKDNPVKITNAELQALDNSVAQASMIINLTLSGVKGGLAQAQSDESTLDAQITAGMLSPKSLSQAEVSEMENSLNTIGGNINSKSLMIDEMNQMMSGVSSGGKSLTATLTTPLRDQVNAENEQYTALRAGLKSLRVAAGINFPTNYDSAPVERDPVPTSAAAKPAPALTHGQLWRPLDKTSIPSPAPVPTAPILPNNLSIISKAQMLLLPADSGVPATVKDDGMRRLGETQTVGEPGPRSSLVYFQGSPDTCGLVAEQEVLSAYHLIPNKDITATDPVKQQIQLKAQVTKAGLFDSGTSSDLSGALLELYHLPTKVVYQASIDQLNTAVKSGDFVIVSVNAAPLWTFRQFSDPSLANFSAPKGAILGHNILITGAEISKLDDGSVLGYYINDSGVSQNNSYFVPAVTFGQMWGSANNFVQVLK